MTLSGLAGRNLLRHRFRLALTVVGVAVAVTTFILLRTVSWAWTMGIEAAAKDRVVTRHKVTFVMSLPKHYIEVVRQAPHIRQATYASWFGGKDPAHDKEFFSTLAVEAKTYLDVYSEMRVPKDQKEAWLARRDGAIIGDMIAKKLGWKVGDRVTLQSGIYAGDWSFLISGIYTATAKSVDRSTLIFHWDYLNDALSAPRQNEIGWIVSRVDDPSKSAHVGLGLDKIFEEKDTQTLSQDERSFNMSFLGGASAVLKALDLISIVILIVMMLILGNTIAMGVRERTNEYGVLRALGFLPKHLGFFIVSESMLVALMGGALGLLLSYPFVEKGVGRWIEENLGAFFPYFRVDTSVALSAIVGCIIVGAVAAALPARRAMKLQVVDALRRVA